MNAFVGRVTGELKTVPAWIWGALALIAIATWRMPPPPAPGGLGIEDVRGPYGGAHLPGMNPGGLWNPDGGTFYARAYGAPHALFHLCPVDPTWNNRRFVWPSSSVFDQLIPPNQDQNSAQAYGAEPNGGGEDGC